MSAVTTSRRSYALLADGTTIEIRPVEPDDLKMVRRFNRAMSPDNLYLRFFSISRRAAEQEAQRVCRPPDPDHVALLAWLGDRVVGIASYERTATAGVAEVAFAVADDLHGHGIATLLLEHLVSIGRARHVEAFCAQTLAENSAMLRVFADAGLSVERRLEGNVVEVTMPIPKVAALTEADAYLDAVSRRESLADIESLRPLLRPVSVVVVGASRRPGTVGRSILHNIISGGYSGRVYAVNPHAKRLGAIRCLPSVADLPEPVDLAVVAVPPASVPGVAEECGRRGVRGLVVITSALDARQGEELLTACRRHSMRLVGPNCFGIAVPGISLDATFAAAHPAPGVAGLVMQSGGLGFAMLNHLSRIGIGVSSFASVGNKYDVSSNDLLTWWEQDGLTRLAVLYLESFGSPRKFARTARRVGRTMPVLTVYAARTKEAQLAAASHTAAIATPLTSREALFEQAGLIATETFGELLDAAALLATQPVPAGPRVAVVSNVGGAGVLAADACVHCGLIVHTPSDSVQRRLGKIIPPGGALTGPVDTTAAITPARFRRCLELIAADDGVDAMLALVLPTATNDLLPAVCAADIRIPLATVVLDQSEGVRLIARTTRVAARSTHRARDTRSDRPAVAPPAVASRVPAYAYPESAARALGHAVRYGAWLAQPSEDGEALPDLRQADARELVAGFLGRVPGGGWLPPRKTGELLGCYQVPLVPSPAATSEDEAVAMADKLGGHVVLKADVPGVLHKRAAGAVALDLRDSQEVRAAYRRFDDVFGGLLTGVLVQPMVTGGTEVIIGVIQDALFGPLVIFGLGGVATEALADHAARLAPLTSADANDLINSTRAGALLQGQRGTPAADVAALRETLLRISRLADDLPQVAELDLNPVIARPDGVFTVDARIRVTSRETADPFLRQLRNPSHTGPPQQNPHQIPGLKADL
ncbi:GNAT family N-acetyltransferase [Streptomyces sp. RB6PN25]|uniref:GNAT family N-acetyltransferase n=1 Tax=Streptomyces humicola TaxID=2953240 RepID=A0ABT1Q4F6_9ACTN|nr:bifunctional GNAT family N-acetyltransferase/acetate--CoA ligase family protein [Streptomyces humicola]MCQ4084806.1 GNAT family N-acetyltransferase [Streptomyces humicola]